MAGFCISLRAVIIYSMAAFALSMIPARGCAETTTTTFANWMNP